jgi:hypothetical protein
VTAAALQKVESQQGRPFSFAAARAPLTGAPQARIVSFPTPLPP